MRKVALVGYGRWGKVLFAHLQRQFDVVCVFGRSIEERGMFTNHLDRVLNSEAEGVVIATPINTHFDITRTVLLSGKHVFCEKPLALDPREANQLVDIAGSRNLQLVTDYTYTFSKRLTEAQTALAKGEKGRLREMLMSLKRNVKGEGNVYWVLVSHMVAVLGMFTDLAQLEFEKKDSPGRRGIVFFWGEVEGVILADMGAVEKRTGVFLCTDSGVLEFNDLLRDDNLGYAMEYFDGVLKGEVDNRSNLKRALSVTDVLWELQR